MRITVNNLTHKYNKKSSAKALDAVSLEIPEGDFLGVVGHTGSGKSTFILHLNTLLKVQEGSLKIGDIDVSANVKKKKKQARSDNRFLTEKVGMVFQYPEHQLFAETVYEDVAFGIKNFFPELNEKEVENRVIEALSAVGLDYAGIKDKSPFLISGGQKRRVAIAGVICVKPEILVLDEPCAGLDPVGKTELWKLLKELHSSFAKTIIVVSHDMNDVCENCRSVALFDHGKLLFQGRTRDLFSHPELIEQAGLELPVTAYLIRELGLEDLDCDYTIDDFCRKLSAKVISYQ